MFRKKNNIIVKTTQDHYNEVLEIGTAVQSAFKTDKDRIYRRRRNVEIAQ